MVSLKIFSLPSRFKVEPFRRYCLPKASEFLLRAELRAIAKHNFLLSNFRNMGHNMMVYLHFRIILLG